jgi:hypothetical protein
MGRTLVDVKHTWLPSCNVIFTDPTHGNTLFAGHLGNVSKYIPQANINGEEKPSPGKVHPNHRLASV